MADDSFLDFLLTESDELIASSSPDGEMPVAMAPMAPVLSVPSSFPSEDSGTSTSYLPDAKVPAHMLLGKSLEALSSQLAHAPLEQLVLTSVGQEAAATLSGMRKSLRPATPPSPLIRALSPTTLADIVRQYNCPTVCLVMRRPGCPFCREDALELSRFVQQEVEQQRQDHHYKNLSSSSSQGGPQPEEEPEQPSPPPPLHLIGIVKDAASDALGLYELATRYFPHDLYRDVGLATYEGLGNRTVTKSDLLRLPQGLRRTGRQNIAWNMTGWTDAVQGGVLIFDATGMLRYVHHEIYADQLVMDDICAAVHAVQREQQQQQREQQPQQRR
jgi:hypothetical protein